VVIGNRIECSVATGLPITSDSKEFADSLLASGVRLAIVKDGANGVLVADKSGSRVIPGIKVRVRCGLGAGDAFGAGVVHGLLNNWTPAQSVEFANAAGAHVASQLMCSDAMPTEIEVKNLMSTK
jgi:5-dehydro-2-deoxygluconokinase